MTLRPYDEKALTEPNTRTNFLLTSSSSVCSLKIAMRFVSRTIPYQNKEHFKRITDWLIKILIFSSTAQCIGYTDAKLCRGVLKDFVTIELKKELIWMQKIKKNKFLFGDLENQGPNKLCDIQRGCFQLYPNVKVEQDTAGRHCSLNESEFHLFSSSQVRFYFHDGKIVT